MNIFPIGFTEDSGRQDPKKKFDHRYLLFYCDEILQKNAREEETKRKATTTRKKKEKKRQIINKNKHYFVVKISQF